MSPEELKKRREVEDRIAAIKDAYKLVFGDDCPLEGLATAVASRIAEQAARLLKNQLDGLDVKDCIMALDIIAAEMASRSDKERDELIASFKKGDGRKEEIIRNTLRSDLEKPLTGEPGPAAKVQAVKKVSS